jgi:hypothetical protein
MEVDDFEDEVFSEDVFVVLSTEEVVEIEADTTEVDQTHGLSICSSRPSSMVQLHWCTQKLLPK